MPAKHRHAMPFGAELLCSGGVAFRLYAPSATVVTLALQTPSGDVERPLARRPDGFFETVEARAAAGTRYGFVVDGLRVPDPAARFAPDGVHGPSVVVDPAAFEWHDDTWSGRPWNEHVFYELHVGTFTPAGTYAAAQRKLAYLAELGVTALELMPLADVPGARNWGYDGVLPFAPSHNYGSPGELKSFIAAAHAHGLAMYLDVVYNHFGPEGNYLHAYGREFYTERHKTPWGSAIDLELPERATVRAFFIENALYWLQEYRFDGLRLDAVHAIYGGTERPFLRELAATVHARADRPVALIVENEDNESTVLDAGYRAQWNDDAHHAAHVLLTGQRDGYYGDYAPAAELLGRALAKGFAYQGEPSPHRGGRPRGEASGHLPLASFVTFLQNHDQIGNRPFGERITALASGDAIRAIVAVLLLAPSIPLLFMGEEWGASTPFQYFCDFEPELARAVTEGRRAEFGSFAEFADPTARERIPDPAAAATFERSKLRWEERETAPHRTWLAYYRTLLGIRAAQIAPRIAKIRGPQSHYETIGTSGLRLQFRLDDATTLSLEANLADAAAHGYSASPNGRVIFATHQAAYPNSIAPAWSVRWTVD